MLDINLFRKEEDAEKIRNSQKHRYAKVEIVDEVIKLDKERRDGQFALDNLRKEFNTLNKTVAELKIGGKNATEEVKDMAEKKKLIADKEKEVEEVEVELRSRLATIGNIVHVHESMLVSNNEADNKVIRWWGEKKVGKELKNHVELVELLGIANLKKGAKVAGGRGYYLIDDGVLLNQALINFGLNFLRKKGYTAVQPPFFMTKDIMAKCAQLAQFDEELYKVTGEGEEKYLIATAEQPLSALHINESMNPTELPIRYVGYSSCFRKEAGAHGYDRGIFRVHQFEKVEQFCITSPNGNESWEMFEEMIKNSEEFYQELNIPYQVVEIVSGALNDAAAKKYDLEGWFPASNAYRELVSCSNCTDYHSRRLGIRYGEKQRIEDGKVKEFQPYCHLLNSTLTATQRTICCILENYQKDDGVEIPMALRNYMGGKDFISFKNNPSTRQGNKPKANVKGN